MASGNKRLLITGAGGQLGLDLQKECLRRSIPCTALRKTELDVTDWSTVRSCLLREKPYAIINCAAFNGVDQAEEQSSLANAVNGLGPRLLACAAELMGACLVHFSTDYVFDGNTNTAYTVADQPRPLSRYGLSKLLGETEVRSLCQRHFVIRLSWVFGTGNTNFAKKVLQWSKGNRRLQVVDDQVSCPSYTVDLAPAILDLLDLGAFGLYHLNNSGHASRYDWAKKIVEYAKAPVVVEPVNSRAFVTPAQRPAFSVLSTDLSDRLLARLLPTWEDATRRFLQEEGVLG